MYNQKLNKSASVKYLNEILGLPLDLSQSLFNYFKGEEKVKTSFYMGKIRKEVAKILENAAQLTADPSFIENIFPFKSQKQEKHRYHEQIKYMTAVNRKFAPWVTKLIDAGTIQEEDFVKIKDLLRRYEELVRAGTITGEEALIDFFEDDSHLFRYLKKYKVDTVNFEELMADPDVRQGSRVIARKETEDFDIVALWVHDYPAMAALAQKDTSWCVAQDEGTFNDYDPPEYHMFFFNGEPQILIHKASGQIKAQDDSTAFDPLMIYSIKDIIDDYELNGGVDDFEDYTKILSRYEAFATYPKNQIENYLEDDPLNIIYVSPDKYGLYVGTFVKNMRKLTTHQIGKLPKSFMDYLGKYLKMNGLDTQFHFMENLITNFLHEDDHSHYFKKIPEPFRTQHVYEEGYLGSIKEALAESFSVEYSLDLISKLNDKQRRDPELITIFLGGITNDFSRREPSAYDMGNLVDSFERLGEKDTYGLEGQIREAITRSIANALIKAPELYNRIESPAIKLSPFMFEATKEAIKVNPEIYLLVPDEIRDNFRYAVLRGYINVARQVAAGQESQERLKDAPEYVRKNTGFIKILEKGEMNPSLDLAYRLNQLVKIDDEIETKPNEFRAYDAYTRIRNLIGDIPQQEFLDPKNLTAVLDFMKAKGSQFIHLPKSLRRNEEIQSAAAEGIMSMSGSDIRRFSYPTELQRKIEEAIKERDAESTQYRNLRERTNISEYMELEEVKTLIKDLLASGTTGQILNIFKKHDLLYETDFLYDEVLEPLRAKVVKDFFDTYVSTDTYDSIAFFHKIYAEEFFTEEMLQTIRNEYMKKISNTSDGKSLGHELDAVIDMSKKLNNIIPGAYIMDENFINATYELAVKGAIQILSQSENRSYSSDELKDLNAGYDNRLAFDERVISYARELAQTAMEKRNFAWFVRLNTMFRFSDDPNFMRGQEVGNLYSSNWYKRMKIGSNKAHWYNVIKARKPWIALCSHCGLVSQDSDNIVGVGNKLSNEEQLSIRDKVGLTHGLCHECCVQLYGEEVCRGLK